MLVPANSKGLLVQHQLFMLVGSCPGVGKSTVTAFLARQLMARDVSTRCMLENALAHLDVLAPIREGFHRENSDKIKVLLAVAKALAEECMRSSKVYLIDAFLRTMPACMRICQPCIQW